MRDFLRWWASQLAELLPAALLRLGRPNDDALIIAPIGPLLQGVDAVAVSLRRGGLETPLGHFALSAAGLAELPISDGIPTVLRLADADVLTKVVVLPLATERDLAQALSFEMDRETPFAADELYWNHRIEARDRHLGTLSARLFLVPRTRLADLLRTLGYFALSPRRAEIAIDGVRGCELSLNSDHAATDKPSRWLVRVAAASCVVLAIAAIALPFVQQQIALSALDAEIAAQQAAATETANLHNEIVRLSGSIEAIAKEREQTGVPLLVLVATTRVLPDDTYLTELALRQRKITIVGRSPAAARLIGVLASDGEFHNPAFAAPVTRIEAAHTELFTIIAEVGP